MNVGRFHFASYLVAVVCSQFVHCLLHRSIILVCELILVLVPVLVSCQMLVLIRRLFHSVFINVNYTADFWSNCRLPSDFWWTKVNTVVYSCCKRHSANLARPPSVCLRDMGLDLCWSDLTEIAENCWHVCAILLCLCSSYVWSCNKYTLWPGVKV